MIKKLIRELPVGIQEILFSPLWGGNSLKSAGRISREKKVFKQYDALTLNELERMQLRELKRIVAYAYIHVPFYRHSWDQANFNPEQLKSFDDMNRIPMIDKSTIINHLDELISDEVKKENLIEHRTGGSTGIPTLLYYDNKTKEKRIEMVHRWRNNAGVLFPFSKSVTIFQTSERITSNREKWGSNGNCYFGTYDMFSNSLCFSTMNLTDEVKYEYVKKMKILKPDFIQGYTSAINSLAKFMLERNEKLRMKAVLCSSEFLTDGMRKNLENVFQCKVFDRYGQGEEVASAIECEEHDGYHIDMDKCYVQVVDENGEAIYERKGTIVGTSLINYAMPLIRYNMHDGGALSKRQCSCGRESWKLYDLTGRSNDVLRFASGRIADSATLSTIFSDSSLIFKDTISQKVEEYQFEQFSFEDIRMNIVLSTGVNLEKEEQIQLENILIDTLGENVKIKICQCCVLNRGNSGKMRFIMNHMDIKDVNF